MSRRMDREGVHRMEPQGIKNRRFWDDPRCKEDERGWVQPFTVWQGWDELNLAIWYLRYRLLPPFGKYHVYERADLIRIIRGNIARSRKCDAPSLPKDHQLELANGIDSLPAWRSATNAAYRAIENAQGGM